MVKSRQLLRLGLLVVLALGMALVALRWSSGQAGFATPDDCLTAYYEAVQAGNRAAFQYCFTESFRPEMQRRFPDAEALRRKGVKSWVRAGTPEIKDAVARVEVEEVRKESIQRVRFGLERNARGWLIATIEPLEEKLPPIPYGTDIREGSKGP